MNARMSSLIALTGALGLGSGLPEPLLAPTPSKPGTTPSKLIIRSESGHSSSYRKPGNRTASHWPLCTEAEARVFSSPGRGVRGLAAGGW